MNVPPRAKSAGHSNGAPESTVHRKPITCSTIVMHTCPGGQYGACHTAWFDSYVNDGVSSAIVSPLAGPLTIETVSGGGITVAVMLTLVVFPDGSEQVTTMVLVPNISGIVVPLVGEQLTEPESSVVVKFSRHEPPLVPDVTGQ